ncbi:MAG: NACHT domain-containing protein [Ardenticatenia bacterium]|nr:NACHT domain-containing protein [Ardenticatenia bacterium]
MEILLDSAGVDKLEINWASPDLSVNDLGSGHGGGPCCRPCALVEAVLSDKGRAGFHEAIRDLIAPGGKEAAAADVGDDPSGHPTAPRLRPLRASSARPAAELPADLVTRMLAIAPAAQDLTAYRLARVAWWRRPRLEQDLDRRFTRLTLVMDQGEKTLGQRWQPGSDRYTDLRKVLAAVDGMHPVLVLLGEPGAGKTTLLRRLELDLVMDTLGAAQPASAAAPITFYQQLSDFKERDTEMTPRAWLAQRWADAWPRLPGLEAMLASPRPVFLLLDALNEMPHGGQADYEARLSEWRTDLLRWTQERPALRVLFSCRSLDYSEPLSCDDLPVPQVQINRLDDEQIQEFLAHYLPERAEAVWRQLAEDERQVDLFRTPYYLRLLTQQVGQYGVIPPGRAALFTGFVRQALRRELRRERDHARRLLTAGDLLSDRTEAGASDAGPRMPAGGGPLVGGLARLPYGMQGGARQSIARSQWLARGPEPAGAPVRICWKPAPPWAYWSRTNCASR